MGRENKNIFVVSKADADFRKSLLLNELDYKALTRLHKSTEVYICRCCEQKITS